MGTALKNIAGISPDKRALLELLLKEQGLSPYQLLPIPRRQEDNYLPLSPSQERLWFVEQLTPAGHLYNVPTTLSFKGPLNVSALERSLNEIVRRHEALRTSFIIVDGKPRQFISDFGLTLPQVDLTHLSSDQRAAAAQALLVKYATELFDLTRGPLLRANLIRLSPEDHLLLLVMHHIITDGWSIGVCVRELTLLYEAYSAGRPSPLDELEIQYGDVAIWQQKVLESGELEQQLEFWRRQFCSGVPVLELPADKARATVRSTAGARESFLIDSELTASLKRIGHEAGVTPFMLLLAAFQVLLARYSGQDEFLIGADMANRERPETKDLIGFFVNMLVIRGDLSGNPTFRELLSRVKEICLGAYANQDVPFEKIVKELAADRDLSRNPLFEVVFVLQNTPMPDVELSGLRINGVEVDTESTPFDLVLSISEMQDRLVGGLLYNRDLYKPERVQQMVRHYQQVLAAVAADADVPVWRLKLLSAAEEREQVETWNTTEREFPRESCIQELFEAHAQQHPKAVAVVYDTEQLSYGELNERANQLAHYLRKRGVGPEVVVGVCLERSVELVVSLLGILKAGGAYLPLDPSYPLERLAYLVEDAQASLVLTKQANLDALPAQWLQVVSVDGDAEEIAAESKENPERQGWAENLAYVMYTSGSTGEPKGIGVTHRNVLRLVCNAEYAELNEQTVSLQLASVSFDAATFELWGTLLNGGKLVLYPGVVASATELGALVREQGVETLWLTSALYNAVVEQGVAELVGLRQLLIGGEALSVSHVRRGLAALAGVELINGYGPTEVTTFSCTHRIRSSAGEGWEQGVPIGKPIGNTAAYVLDVRQELVPVGVVGELYLGGEGLARGYVGAAALTSERFVPHPFSKEAGARLYRTGDLVRYRRDGELEFMGRVDEQLKIRGFRIEPGEVESVLRAHEQVAEAVVLGRQEESGEKRLVAYVVLKSEEPVSAAELRLYLKERLPEYMVPAGFVYLAELPLNANGKVDRAALPAPEWEQARGAQEYVGPRTAVEEVLCGIWAEVLRVERVGIYDNFFELGGDSILSIQIVAKAQERGVRCSIQQLFQHPQIAALAEQLAMGTAEVAEVTERLEPFSLLSEADRKQLPEGVVDAYPVAQLQAGMIFHSEYSPESAVYHDIFSYRLQAPLDEAALRETLQELGQRHGVLRTSFALSGYSEPLQLVHEAVEIPLVVTDLSGLSESEQQAAVRAAVAAEKERGFEWGQAPLMRVIVHRCGEESFQFTLSFHHALLDGWSLVLLMTEFFQHYWFLIGRSDKDIDSLPEWSYGEFVKLERQAIESKECQSYWQREMVGCQMTKLPRWTPGKRAPRSESRDEEVWINHEVVEGLKRLAQRCAAPLKSVLLAAHLRVMSLLSGERNVTTGVVWHGRPEEVDGERVVGLFLNTLPFGMDLKGGSWIDLVKEVFARETAMMPYRRYPLSELQRQAGSAESSEVAFNFIHFHVFQGALELSGMELGGSESQTQTNFPLVVNFGLDPFGQQLQLTLQYERGEFSEAQVQQISEYYERALQAMAQEPEADYENAELLGEAEREHLLWGWTEPAVEYEGDSCLEKLFEEQVERSGAEVALVLGEEQLTYAELNKRANQLAHYLKQRGVRPEDLVVLHLERSFEMIVAMLAVLKAGGAYVPLDATTPSLRSAFIIDDTRATVVITDAHLRHQLPATEATVICLDEQQAVLAAQCADNPRSFVRAENVAYVIYTSGSTGKPKGVLVTHKNVSRLFQATQDAYDFCERDVWTQFHSSGFDFSVWEIWGALLYGGRLVIVPQSVSRSPEDLYQLLIKERVTVLNQTPSAFHQLMRTDERLHATSQLSLRLVIFGGEALDLSNLQGWFDRHGDQCPQLVNMYGITETTVHVTYRPLTVADTQGAHGSRIGTPLRDLSVYVLDDRQQPVPVGVRGEMYVGGAGVARGYLHRPELTAERFVPDPFSATPGARLYRSGDTARLLAEGELEYLGRADSQVKVRGFRIEPAEIEIVLSQHPSIREAVVVAQADTDGSNRLVAYIVVQEGPAPNVDQLRRYLQEHLPTYMIPAAFVTLEQMPLTANGKIDRRALPRNEAARPALEQPFVAPRTLQERQLAEIWSKVLKVERIGIYDNFFSLGGDSIRSIQVRAEAKRLGLNFSLQALFQHATIAELVEHLDETPERVELGVQEPFSLITEEDRRLLGDVADAYPLTMLQAGMVFHSEYSPESAFYHNLNKLSLKARFDAACLTRTLETVAAHHEVLRSSFSLSKYSAPLQLVHQSIAVPLTIEDLRELAPAEQEERINAWFEIEKSRRFKLSEAPLWRVHVHLRGDDEFDLTFTEHHSILDGWSAATLISEILSTYLAFLKDEELASRAPARNIFRDYVELEHQALASAQSRDFWIRELEDANATKLPRWPLRAAAGGETPDHSVMLSSELTGALIELSRALGVPVKSVLLAAHLRVISVVSNQADVVTGLVSNTRSEDADADQALGLFLNTVPIRQRLPGGAWTDLAREVFQTEARVLPFRRYPTAQIFQLKQSQSLFETAFNFTHFHLLGNVLDMPELQVRSSQYFAKTNFPLLVNFGLDPYGQQLEMALQYDGQEFSAEQIKQIAGYYERALEAIAREPEADYEKVELLGEAERAQLLWGWNETAVEYEGASCLEELFEEQVERSGAAVALAFGEEQLTYAELNERANQLAHYLKRRGVGPEVLVGVCLERSVEMVVSLLGILKAGGAYVPLDPEYPQERLGYLLADTGVRVVLTQARWREKLAGNAAEVVCVDQMQDVLAQERGTNPEHESWGEKLAYVIYTSGSTGQPKGAMNTHAGIRNRLLWLQAQCPMGPGDRVLQKTPYSFDVSVWEFFWPLLTGATLVMAMPGGHQDNGYLERVIKAEGITTVHFVPSMLRQFLEEPGVEGCGTLKRVICSGEALGYDLQQRFFQRLDAELLNLYGPTETSVEVTYWECQRESELQTVPIGYPIANCWMYVLNRQMQAVPVGVAGELYIGGRGVGRGYLGRAALTSERFIPDPYSAVAGARLYRTGDVVRYLPNGAIEYLGRADHQVKIRGFRIELAEIEQALASHPAIKECVVTARADGDHQRLVAFVVAARDEAPNNSELFKYLKEKLPEYMVPSTFVWLSELPLNAHGKVDRNALPAPGGERPILDREYVAPRTPEEELLAGVWSQVLGIREIGVHDNFFELGGHSLLATQIISRTREAFQVDLPLRALFESPTVAELVERIEQQRLATQAHEQAPPLVTIERSELLPLSFAQQRLWFLDQLESGISFYNLSAAIRLTGDLDVAALEQALTEISGRHESLRTTFHDIDGQPIQSISDPQPVKLPVRDLSGLSDAERQSTLDHSLREESNRPFDLQRGPLFRMALWRLAEQEYVLLTTMHHIISDGWSMTVFVRELVLLYEAHRNQQPLALPELPIQPADFAHWQRQWMQGDVLQAQLDYWRARLGGSLPLLELPADRARPATPSYRGAMEMFLFPEDMIEPLQKLSRHEGVTLFMMLFAAWQTLLYRYTGQPDVVTGSVIANRNRSEIEGLIGFFVNTLVLRSDLSGNPTFRELLVRVREVCLGAYAHQDVPFEQLVEVLQPERAASHMPLFRSMFTFQAAPAAGIELPSLKLDMLELDVETTPFDLSLSLAAGPQGPLAVLVRYSTDLFDAATIKRTIKHYETLLRSIVAAPETQIDELEIYTQAEKDQRAQEKSGRKELKLQKLKNLKPKAVTVSAENLIKTEYLSSDTKLPLVIQPQVEGINLARWAGANREFIDREVLSHGAVLFRNFEMNSLVKFEQFAETLCPDLMTYSERSSPRGTLGGHVYTSTTHPAEQSIHLHNEHSYTLRWPMKLWFYCVEPAPQGGRTPIADSRNILRRIDPRIVEKFIEKQIMYVRNYGDGLGLPWQEVFQTSDRSVVEEYCRLNSIEVQWKDDNRLRTRQVRPAVRKHPRSGVPVWFNHAAFFHVTNLEEVERQATLSVLSEDELPFNTFYGDGSPIEAGFLEEVREAYRAETVSFPWQREDILMIDNMLVAHGRDPYSGPRRIVFIMADPIQNPDQTTNN